MKAQNLKKVTELCKKLDQLKNHHQNISIAYSDDIPVEQDEKFQIYLSNLSKEIKKIEKELADL